MESKHYRDFAGSTNILSSVQLTAFTAKASQQLPVHSSQTCPLMDLHALICIRCDSCSAADPTSSISSPTVHSLDYRLDNNGMTVIDSNNSSSMGVMDSNNATCPDLTSPENDATACFVAVHHSSLSELASTAEEQVPHDNHSNSSEATVESLPKSVSSEDTKEQDPCAASEPPPVPLEVIPAPAPELEPWVKQILESAQLTQPHLADPLHGIMSSPTAYGAYAAPHNLVR